jgi:hypothetical protein
MILWSLLIKSIHQRSDSEGVVQRVHLARTVLPLHSLQLLLETRLEVAVDLKGVQRRTLVQQSVERVDVLFFP